jgi:amidase
MTRSVKNAATILQVIAGKDSMDVKTDHIPFFTLLDYVVSCR